MALETSKFNRIMAEYDQKQYRRNRELLARKEKLFRLVPDYKKTENEYISACAGKARLMITGSPADIAAAGETARQLSEKKKRLLKENGFPEDYLDVPYECGLCRDTGFIDSRQCECLKRAISEVILKDTCGDSSRDHDFEHFDFSLFPDDEEYYDPALRLTPYTNIISVVNKAKIFISEFSLPYAERKHKNFYIYGNPGVGKTFLLNCISKELIAQGKEVCYITASDMFHILYEQYYHSGQAGQDILSLAERLRNDALLIIDDLGSENGTSFTMSQLLALVNHRLNHDRSTIITTNIDLKDIHEHYDDRLFSRLSGEYSFLKIFGNDLRLEKI